MKFVIAKCYFDGNYINQEIKEYPSLLAAYSSEAAADWGYDSDEYDRHLSIEEFKEYFFDVDMLINILEMPE